MLPFELQIGLRYTHAKRSNHFISFISIVSMAGIALGVMALIVVLSVMNGFQEELRARILGVAAHLEISGQADRLADWRGVRRRRSRTRKSLPARPTSTHRACWQTVTRCVGRSSAACCRNSKARWPIFPAHEGGKTVRPQPGEFGIILGAELARVLNVYPGDKLVLLTPQGKITPAGVMPRLKQFTVTGIFEVGMYRIRLRAGADSSAGCGPAATAGRLTCRACG